MVKELDPAIKTTNKTPIGLDEQMVLSNLYHALKNGGWNEELLHEAIEKILENNRRK